MSEKIFACIDAQGFTVGGIFFPRELSIVNDSLNICLEIDTGLKSNEITIADNRTCKWLRYNLLGMTKRPQRAKLGLRCIKNSEVINIIENYHKKFSSKEKFLFGVKNDSLLNMLSDAGIPHIDMETIGCPSSYCLDISYGSPWFCSYHTLLPRCNRKQFRCALRKSTYMWNWLKEENNTNDLIKSINEIVI